MRFRSISTLAVTVAGLFALYSSLAPAYACSAYQEALCSGNPALVPGRSAVLVLLARLCGSMADINTWNPAPAWVQSSDWIMVSDSHSNGYGQIGTMHINGDTTQRLFVEFINNSG